MLMLNLQAYEALGSLHWTISVRDLDAGPDEPGLMLLCRGAQPAREGLDSLDNLVLLAHQALDRAVESHMMGQSETME